MSIFLLLAGVGSTANGCGSQVPTATPSLDDVVKMRDKLMAEVAAATCLEQVRLLVAKLAIVGGEVAFNATLASASVQSKWTSVPTCDACLSGGGAPCSGGLAGA